MKLFKSYSEKEVKRVMPIVKKINSYEDKLESLSDEELKAKTQEFRDEIEDGKSLDDILPEAFAVVREASKRVTGMRHFDVQLIGGIILHQGRIAEMRTGEGKTLVATLPAYLNALTGKGVHIITVNDYLARRDSEWMGKIYNFLGLTVGLVIAGMTPKEKQEAYSCDIIPCSGGHPEWHIQGDCVPLLNGNCEFITMDNIKHNINKKWDLIIAHPPCTYLTCSGNRWFNVEKYG